MLRPSQDGKIQDRQKIMTKIAITHQLCATCIFFNEQIHIHEIDMGQGRCHRYPPVFTESSSGDKSHHWQYPLIHTTNWCGEHSKTASKKLAGQQ